MLPVDYCTTEDGVRIAFCAEGDGPPLLLTHFVYAFSLSHHVPTFHEALQRLGRGRRFIRYDIRGTGLSDRDVEDMSPEGQIRDLEAVVRAAGLQEFTLMGVAHGGVRAIEYAARHPGQVSGLVLYETYPCATAVFTKEMLTAVTGLARADWRLATRAMVDTGIRRDDETEGLRWAQMLEESISGEAMARNIELTMDHDVRDMLPLIKCRTLVCHSRNDRLYPFSLAEEMARRIPDARLVPLEAEPGGPFTDPTEAIGAIDMFLPGARATSTDGVGVGPTPIGKLTAREMEILKLVAAGRTSGEISNELSLSIRTVGRHITNIYHKIGARGRADATAYALRHGIANE